MRMPGSFQTATVMLLLAVFVAALLVGVGILRLVLWGTAGPLLRMIGIGVVLLVFTTGLYWRWREESIL